MDHEMDHEIDYGIDYVVNYEKNNKIMVDYFFYDFETNEIILL